MLVFGAANSGYEIEICPGHGIVYAGVKPIMKMNQWQAFCAPWHWLGGHTRVRPTLNEIPSDIKSIDEFYQIVPNFKEAKCVKYSSV